MFYENRKAVIPLSITAFFCFKMDVTAVSTADF